MITPRDGTVAVVADTPDTDLWAVVGPRAFAVERVRAAWAAGVAATVLDPDAPPAVRDGLLDLLRPTHVVDPTGIRPHPGGIPVAGGTAAVVVTSGTTGVGKGVELTTAGAAAVGAGWAAALGHESTDRWLVCLPVHHVAGLAVLARAAVTGAPVEVHEGFAVDAVADAARRGATLVSVVPTMLARLLDAGAPVERFRAMVTGGAPLPPALRDRAAAAGARVVDAYGQSETWGGVLADGVPIPGADVRLGPADEVELHGAMTMRGYRGDPERTAAAFTADGWLRTGDVGSVDDAGRLRIVDRLRDLVITGGVNVSPVAVEQVLAEHPQIADVAVVGAPDPEWGERVVAYVVPTDPADPPTLDDVRAWARDRLRAPQLPRALVLTTGIPRSAGGKTLRRILRGE